jgi:enoyl-CoA hydratase/carnithine racemase
MSGSTIRLRRQIPYCLAAEILLTGRHVTAQEALEWGLINRIVPKGKTLDEALAIKNTEIAEELALPPVKIHCSILAEDAIKAAVADYRTKQTSANSAVEAA